MLVGSQVAASSIHNTLLLLIIVCLCILIFKMRYAINVLCFWTVSREHLPGFPSWKGFSFHHTMVLSVGHQCRAACWCVLAVHMCSEKLTWTLTSPVFVELPHQLLPSHIPGWERHPGGSPWFTPFSESAG